MKRFAVVAIVIVGVVAAAALAIPPLISTEFVKQRIAAEIQRLTGRETTLAGNASLSIYPHLAITIDNVTVKDPARLGGEDFVTTESLTSRLRLVPLLLGRIEFDGFDLVKPRIRLAVAKDGRVNWRMPSGEDEADGAVTRTTAVPTDAGVSQLGAAVGQVSITDGTIIYDNLAGNRREEVTGLALDATWVARGDALAAIGSFQWRGETVEFNGDVGDPLGLAAGRRSTLRFAVAATPLRISFNGNAISLDGQYQFDGEAAMTTPSLRRAITWMGTPMGTGSTLGAASIAGTVNWFGSSVAFANGKIELDGNTAVGGLAADFGGDTTIQGTLASTKLDLSPYLEAARATLVTEPWSVDPAASPIPDGLDLDLRVATDQIVVGPLRTGKAVATASVKEGRITVSVAGAQFNGGTLSARLTVAMEEDALTADAEARLASVRARTTLGVFTGNSAFDGTANASLALTSRGTSWGEFVQGIEGTAEVDVSDGRLAGLDIPALAATAADPLAEPLTESSGVTPFSSIKGTLAVAGGALITHDLVVAGDGFTVGVEGWGSVVTGQLEGTATAVSTGVDEAKLPLLIAGSWSEPLFSVDRERLQELAPAQGDVAPAATRPPD